MRPVLIVDTTWDHRPARTLRQPLGHDFYKILCIEYKIAGVATFFFFRSCCDLFSKCTSKGAEGR